MNQHQRATKSSHPVKRPEQQAEMQPSSASVYRTNQYFTFNVKEAGDLKQNPQAWHFLKDFFAKRVDAVRTARLKDGLAHWYRCTLYDKLRRLENIRDGRLNGLSDAVVAYAQYGGQENEQKMGRNGRGEGERVAGRSREEELIDMPRQMVNSHQGSRLDRHGD